MAYYDQGDPGAGKSRTGKTPGRLHDDRRWQSLVWAFFGLVLGLLLGAIGTALSSDPADRAPFRVDTQPFATGPAANVPELAGGEIGCRLTDNGAIAETPCRLDASTLAALTETDGPLNLLGSRTPPPAPERLPLCNRADDGAITGAPCQIISNRPPAIAPATSEQAPEVRPAGAPSPALPVCRAGADGGVSGTPCRLLSDIDPPEPAPAPAAAPAPDPLPGCQVSEMNGTVTGAPCRLAGNFRASAPSRTLGANLPQRTAPLPDCRIDAATQAITNTPCRLDSAFRPSTGADFGPVPKSALKVCPTGGFTSPEELGCGLRVRDSGYVALSKIAEAYYGDTDAACLIFDRNRDVFGTRQAPVRRNDPHCLLPGDILFMPAMAPDSDYGDCVTPPRKANVCEAG